MIDEVYRVQSPVNTVPRPRPTKPPTPRWSWRCLEVSPFTGIKSSFFNWLPWEQFMVISKPGKQLPIKHITVTWNPFSLLFLVYTNTTKVVSLEYFGKWQESCIYSLFYTSTEPSSSLELGLWTGTDPEQFPVAPQSCSVLTTVTCLPQLSRMINCTVVNSLSRILRLGALQYGKKHWYKSKAGDIIVEKPIKTQCEWQFEKNNSFYFYSCISNHLWYQILQHVEIYFDDCTTWNTALYCICKVECHHYLHRHYLQSVFLHYWHHWHHHCSDRWFKTHHYRQNLRQIFTRGHNVFTVCFLFFLFFFFFYTSVPYTCRYQVNWEKVRLATHCYHTERTGD